MQSNFLLYCLSFCSLKQLYKSFSIYCTVIDFESRINRLNFGDMYRLVCCFIETAPCLPIKCHAPHEAWTHNLYVRGWRAAYCANEATKPHFLHTQFWTDKPWPPKSNSFILESKSMIIIMQNYNKFHPGVPKMSFSQEKDVKGLTMWDLVGKTKH